MLRPEVDVVSSFVAASMPQFAVISVRTVPHCECLVLAYPDEKALRNLLAASSIVALGYNSREEAQASISDRATMAEPLRYKPIATLVAKNMQAIKKSVCNHLPAKGKFSLGKTKSTICGLLQQTFAAVVVLFYSKKVLSAALRAFISF